MDEDDIFMDEDDIFICALNILDWLRYGGVITRATDSMMNTIVQCEGYNSLYKE